MADSQGLKGCTSTSGPRNLANPMGPLADMTLFDWRWSPITLEVLRVYVLRTPITLDLRLPLQPLKPISRPSPLAIILLESKGIANMSWFSGFLNSPQKAITPSHPFYPPDINAVVYVPNTLSLSVLLGFFAIATVAVILLTSAVVKLFTPRIPRTDKILVGWFVFSELILIFTHNIRSKAINMI